MPGNQGPYNSNRQAAQPQEQEVDPGNPANLNQEYFADPQGAPNGYYDKSMDTSSMHVRGGVSYAELSAYGALPPMEQAVVVPERIPPHMIHGNRHHHHNWRYQPEACFVPAYPARLAYAVPGYAVPYEGVGVVAGSGAGWLSVAASFFDDGRGGAGSLNVGPGGVSLNGFFTEGGALARHGHYGRHGHGHGHGHDDERYAYNSGRISAAGHGEDLPAKKLMGLELANAVADRIRNAPQVQGRGGQSFDRSDSPMKKNGPVEKAEAKSIKRDKDRDGIPDALERQQAREAKQRDRDGDERRQQQVRAVRGDRDGDGIKDSQERRIKGSHDVVKQHATRMRDRDDDNQSRGRGRANNIEKDDKPSRNRGRGGR